VKLAKRIGMVHEKRVTGYAVGDGRYEDVEIYAMTAEEYFDLPY
jgi:[ribosomal protein S5]-alanine N-acetyltransferase